MKSLHRHALRWIRGLVVLLLLAAAWEVIAADAPRLRITYLYDNTTAVAGTRSGWGFAALVEVDGRRVLFDTGGDAAILRHNVAVLGVDLTRLDALVLSHEHWDHTNGLSALGARTALPVFHPASVDPRSPWLADLERAGVQRRPVTSSAEVVPGVRVSAEMAAAAVYEIALTIDTDEGLVIVVGCAHPGPEAMLQQIGHQAGRPILMMIGGWHLLQSTMPEIRATLDALRAAGVRHAGPTHCTGDAAITAARSAFGERFVEGGVGAVVEFAPFRRTTAR